MRPICLHTAEDAQLLERARDIYLLHLATDALEPVNVDSGIKHILLISIKQAHFLYYCIILKTKKKLTNPKVNYSLSFCII